MPIASAESHAEATALASGITTMQRLTILRDAIAEFGRLVAAVKMAYNERRQQYTKQGHVDTAAKIQILFARRKQCQSVYTNTLLAFHARGMHRTQYVSATLRWLVGQCVTAEQNGAVELLNIHWGEMTHSSYRQTVKCIAHVVG